MKKGKGRKWIFSQTKGCRFRLFILVTTRITIVGVNLGMAMLLSGFIEFAVGNSKWPLIYMLVVAGSLFALEGIVYTVESVCKKSIYCYMELNIRSQLLQKIQKSDLLELRKFSNSELMMRFTKDIEHIALCLPDLIINLFGGLIMAIAAFVYMLIISWKLALIIIISIPILLLIISKFAPLVKRVSKMDKNNEDDNRLHIENVINNTDLCYIFKSQNLFFNKFFNSYQKKKKSSIKLGCVEGLLSFFNNLIGSILFVIVLGVGAIFVARNDFPVGDMISVINLVNYLIWPFANISNSISQFSQAIVSSERILEVMSLENKLSVKMESDVTLPKNQIRIKIQNMCFSYGENEILSNVNLELSQNGIIGVVGKSGSGKSTLLNIIMGLYSPTKGKIRYFRNSNYDSKSIMAWVPANKYIFNASIQENICMDESIDNDKFVQAIKMANAAEFINDLDNKIYQTVGEKKNSLSSGQGQRIALARTYYNSSECFVFDEPTSNLDKKSVDFFINALRILSKHALCIISSHDENVLINCNHVLYVSDGHVSELKNKNEIQDYLNCGYSSIDS